MLRRVCITNGSTHRSLVRRYIQSHAARPAPPTLSLRSSAASGCLGGLEEQPPLPGAVILGRELDRHLANQRLGPRLLLLVFDDVRRRRDPFFPFLYETPTDELKTVPTNQPQAPSSRCAVSTLRPASAFLSSISPFLSLAICAGAVCRDTHHF